MGQFTIKLPDVGEGVAEAELVEWMVKEGENVREDEVLAAVMTDKATVEIPSPVEGKIIWRGAGIGEIIAVGSELIRLEIDGEGNASEDLPQKEEKALVAESAPKASLNGNGQDQSANVSTPAPVIAPVSSASRPSPQMQAVAVRAEGEKPLASPAVRQRAREIGVDLRSVAGSGPAGRIVHGDIDAVLARGPGAATSGSSAKGIRIADTSVQEVPVIGLRRKIAEQMVRAKTRIPHITYVDEVDVTALEELRGRLNKNKREDQPKLTILPFLMRAMVKAISEQPQFNAIYDDEAGVVHQHGGMHMGVATQTPNGLIVPVVRHTEARSLWECAREMGRIAEAARTGAAKKDELSGSTITITSLGAMGGIVTTPVINHPEVAIIGVNKMQTKPVWDGTQFIPRKMMNLSSSFDHRVIDGWDCAVFIQRIKGLLENPAEIFIEE